MELILPYDYLYSPQQSTVPRHPSHLRCEQRRLQILNRRRLPLDENSSDYIHPVAHLHLSMVLSWNTTVTVDCCQMNIKLFTPAYILCKQCSKHENIKVNCQWMCLKWSYSTQAVRGRTFQHIFHYFKQNLCIIKEALEESCHGHQVCQLF